MITNDFAHLATLLYAANICRDTDQLNKIVGRLYNVNHTDEHMYKVVDFEFINIDKIGKSIPVDADDLEIKFSVCIDSKQYTAGIIEDPLNNLKFNIELFGFMLTEGCDIVALHSSWHLDRHIFENSEEESKYLHPHYHFTFGGDKMKAQLGVMDYGQSLILPTPRIAHPPMDAILGIDFIIQNYYTKSKVQDILTDSQYIQIISNAQERLWKPYYMSIFSKWNCAVSANIDSDFNYNKLLPFLHSS